MLRPIENETENRTAETATFAFDSDGDEHDATLIEPTSSDFIDAAPTEQTGALTAEQTLFDEPLPLPAPLAGEPVYIVETRSGRHSLSLLAVRATLDDAVRVADGVHAAVADVTIAEVPLPCDAEVLAAVLHTIRRWQRDANGEWVPPLS
jgi:hypothetical protein